MPWTTGAFWGTTSLAYFLFFQSLWSPGGANISVDASYALTSILAKGLPWISVPKPEGILLYTNYPRYEIDRFGCTAAVLHLSFSVWEGMKVIF